MLEGGNIQVTGYWGGYLLSVRQDGREGSVTGVGIFLPERIIP